MRIKTALSIAGFDPTSGAGITSDIKTFQAHKVYGVGVVTSLTAQNSLRVKHVETISISFFKDQIDALLDDIVPDAAKSGMIYAKDIVRLICAELDYGRIKNMVIDPVITSTSGKALLKRDALHNFMDEMIPRCRVITPNIPEAETISRIGIRGIKDMYRSAENIFNLGAANVIIKGGHLKDDAVDVLFDGDRFYEFKSKRISGSYHGTGCVFSAALAANLALGSPVPEAAKKAKTFVERAVKNSLCIGKGMKFLGI